MPEFSESNSFVVYKLPDSPGNVLICGEPIKLYSLNFADLHGFIFAPFNLSGSLPMLFLEAGLVTKDEDKIRQVLPELFAGIRLNEAPVAQVQMSRTEYLEKVRMLINFLREGVISKVVLSRTQTSGQLAAMELLQLYHTLCETYPSTFVYFAHFPEYGTWMGASPEKLISCRNKQCSTMSLAGSRPAGSDKNWEAKETWEQEMVTRYITQVLAEQNVTDLKISNSFTSKAGHVEHLCTLFTFNLEGQLELGNLIQRLHPTPAVCGTPTDKAMELIHQLEPHCREYYTGFLGPVNPQDQTNIFVNLRCMKIAASNMTVFAGGGITKDSVPEKEWEETELKSRTLLSLIEKMRNLAH